MLLVFLSVRDAGAGLLDPVIGFVSHYLRRLGFLEAADVNDTIRLSARNFARAMADLRYDWLLEFCDREYHGCKQAEPLYADIATKLKGSTRVAKVSAIFALRLASPGHSFVLRLSKIDGTESTSLVKLFNVKSFPSYFVVRKGNMYAYPGRLSADTADNLLAFAKVIHSAASSLRGSI